MIVDKIQKFLENEDLIKFIDFNYKHILRSKRNKVILNKILENSRGLIKNLDELVVFIKYRKKLSDCLFFGRRCAYCNKEIEKVTIWQYYRIIKNPKIKTYCCRSCQVKDEIKEIGNPWHKKEIQKKCIFSRLNNYLNNEGIRDHSQRHILNFNLINENYWKNNFIINGFFDIEKCSKFHNIKINVINKYKKIFNIIAPNKLKHNTLKQNEIFYWLKNIIKNKFIISTNNRNIISHSELDIYIPYKKFAIEFDGIMYHSYGKSKSSKFNNFKDEDKYYHIYKTNKCNKLSITLLHIFENEWNYKKEIWKSVILNKLGLSNKIFARKCIIKEISYLDSKNFLEENHLQGSCLSKINIGLFYNNELVSLMTFGKSRFNKNYDWELLRFCNKLNTSVIGGASKLLKYFRNNYKGSIISYANKRWSNGNLYKKLGFNLVRETEPNYFYFLPNENILYNRILFQKHKLKSKLKIFDENLTETQNMYNNGYRKIYDCGNYVFELK